MIKDLLALVDDGRACAPFIRDMLKTALTLEAHAEIAVLTPLPAPIFGPVAPAYLAEVALHAEARLECDRVRALVETWDADADVWQLHDSLPWLIDDVRRSMPIADLIVVGSKLSWARPSLRRRVLESVILDTGTPLLLLPHGRSMPHVHHAVLGWKASPEALGAMRAVLRLAQPGARLDLVTIGTPPAASPSERDPATALTRHLERHGARVEQHWLDRDGPDADSLQDFAAGRGADLLAVGALAHSRAREILFGGVTRALLDATRLPVLLAR
jgi:nucleotide-binding universal stress UspA family protein